MPSTAQNAAHVPMPDRAVSSHSARMALEQFSQRLAQAYEEVHLLYRMARLLNSVEVPEHLIQIFCNQLFPVLPFSWLAVQFHPQGTPVKELPQQIFLSGQPPCPRDLFEQRARELVEQLKPNEPAKVLAIGDDALA